MRSTGAHAEQPKRSFFARIVQWTWLLPVATATFLVFVAGSVYLIGQLGLTPLLLLVLLLPSFVTTTLALIVALSDLLQRPAERYPLGGRWFWIALVVGLNVLAFLPYWLFVVRPQPAGDERADPTESERSAA